METIKSYQEGSNCIKSQSWGMFTNLELTQSLLSKVYSNFIFLDACNPPKQKKYRRKQLKPK